MARNSADEKWVHTISSENEVEEDEEALSLCDLPTNEENQPRKEEAKSTKTGEDFAFGSWGGSALTEPEMCAADEVFFRGQILPLRHSVSSESGLSMFRSDSRNPSRCISRSVSSRSSSVRSQHSSSSGSSTITDAGTYKQIRVRSQFHSHPSPTPQIRRLSSARHGNVSHRNRKSTAWSFFRVGLVRTPGIELQDLKIRSNNSSINKSFGSRNSTSNKSNSDKNGSTIEKKKKQRFFNINGCKCSVDAVETVPSRGVGITKGNSENANHEGHAKEDRKEEATKKTKQATSRHRTFEWLKELSLAGVPGHEA